MSLLPLMLFCVCFFNFLYNLNFFLAGPFFPPFDYLEIGIFLLVYSFHSVIQFFLISSDVLSWQKK